MHKKTSESIEVVRSLAVFGHSHEQIAAHIGIAPKTLKSHYREILDTAKIEACKQVGDYLFGAASGQLARDGHAPHRDCISAAIFWAKTQMGWRETQQIDVNANITNMTDDDLNKKIAELTQNIVVINNGGTK